MTSARTMILTEADRIDEQAQRLFRAANAAQDNAVALRMAAREMTAQPVADAIERDRLRDQVRVLRQALQAMRNNVDCSTINNSKRSVARWEELVDLATEALKASTP